MSSLTESLAGRAGGFELMPMAINEIRDKLFETPRRRAVVYAGDFENNTGEIEIVNYRNLRI